MMIADTLQNEILSGLEVRPESLFGAGVMVDPAPEAFCELAGSTPWITGNPVFSVFVLICFASYCFMAFRFRSQMGAVLSMFRGKLYIEKLLDEHNFTFETFIDNCIIAVTLVMGLAALRLTELLAGVSLAAALSYWMILALPVVFWLTSLTVWVVQGLIVRMSGTLTLSTSFTGNLMYMRRLIFSLGYILLTPVLLLFLLAPENSALILLVIGGITSVALAGYLLIRTFSLFHEQKVSILFWILYLCAVEIFPLSLPVLFAVKNL